MKILVTGGAGYIGSHTVSALLAQGYEVTVFDNLSTGFRDSLPASVKFVEGDIRDRKSLSDALKGQGFEGVIHFAAKLNVAESVDLPLEYYENNVGGLVNTLSAMKENGIDKMVFSSTAALFGDLTQDRPIREDDPKSPLNPYGQTKWVCEQVIKDCAVAYGLKYCFLRYFNVAGASGDGQNGQRTAKAFHLIHLASQAAVGKRKTLSIFGTDYNTSDGTCVRDYIHVEDLADIHLLGLQHLLKGGASDEFNCGYGQGFSVKEVIDKVLEVSGVFFEVIEAGRRPGDPNSLVADSTKLKKTLGWVPKRNDLAVICKSAIEWERNYR